MKKPKRFLSLLLASVLAVTSIQPAYAASAGSGEAAPIAAEAEATDYTQFVDPFVGTQVDYGQLFPGSVVPYGL